MKNIFLIFITIIISIFSLFKDTSSVFADGNNLIQNNDFEISNLNSPQGWFIGGWGKNISNFTYPVEGYLSNNAVKVEIKTYSDGDAKWYFEDVPVIPGGDYVFSDMYNSNVDTSIVARYKLSNGTYIYKYLGLVPTSSSWKEFKIDFTTPQDVVSLTIFHIINKVGFLVIDNVNLYSKIIENNPIIPDEPIIPIESPPIVISNNFILNSTLEVIDGNIPKNWLKNSRGTNISNFTYPVEGYLSNNAVKVEIKTYSDGDAKWYFEDVPVIPGGDYVFSDMYNSNVDTSIVARYKLSNGSYIYKYLGLVPTSSSWKEFKIDFTTPQDVVSLTIFHIINKVGFLVIDNVTLTTQNNSFSEGMISFSFDDGFKNIYDLAIPILDNAGIKSTQAVMTSSFNYPMYMSKEEVKKLYDNGHEIASHTMNHVNLTQVSIETAIEEISKSKSDLLDIGINVTSFVYPYGAYNNQTINILKESGYLGARSVFQGFNTPNSDKFQLKDMHVDGNATWENIKLGIDKAINEKKWLILEFHQQGENLGYYSNTTEFLQKIVDYVVEKKVKTITIAQGIEMIN